MAVPLPVANLIPLLSTGSVTVRRRGQPTINALGDRVPAAYVDLVFPEAVVHPANAADLDQVPTANRANEHITINAELEIRTAQGSSVPDEVLWDGHWYKVISVSNYEAQGAVYFALAERMRGQS